MFAQVKSAKAVDWSAIPQVENLTTPADTNWKPDSCSSSVYQLDVPFIGFAGRCFLRGCLWAELLESWIRKKQKSSDARAEAAATRYHLHVMGWLRSSFGAASCTAAAGCLVLLFSGSAHRAAVPFLFLLVILCVALRFGTIAGVIGTICAALVFEIFLFEPKISLAINSSVARNHLISMVILGVCASEVLGHRKRHIEYKQW
jgi:hypothetical protein